MNTNFAVLDSAVTRELDRRHADAPSTITTEDRASAKKTARKIVAGFELADEAAERKMLDELIASRRQVIEVFKTERTKITKKLNEKGIDPLVVLPTTAWHAICNQAGLFRLSPDAHGRVGIDANKLVQFLQKGASSAVNTWGKKFDFNTYRASPEGQRALEALSHKDWPEYLRTIFGGQVSLPIVQSYNGGHSATLILPTPPADVQEILLKAHGSIPMKVAAVSDAISFKETPTELLDRVSRSMEEASHKYEAWKKDPIIYTEDGMVTAVLAQFGDFPIEKEVVELVVKSKDLIPEKPTQVQTITTAGIGLDALYRQQFNQYAQQQPIMPAGGYVGGGYAGIGIGGGSGGGWVGSGTANMVSTGQFHDSTRWTG